MKRCVILPGILLFTALASAQSPSVLVMNASRLSELKKIQQQPGSEIRQIVSTLQMRADSILSMRPLSVMDKEFMPVSGNKHDYMSQAPYFWYDSSKPNGLPYLRRDGVRNPEINKITDHKHLDELHESVHTLSIDYYFTLEEKYAQKANDLLRYWFLED